MGTKCTYAVIGNNSLTSQHLKYEIIKTIEKGSETTWTFEVTYESAIYEENVLNG